MLHPAASMAAAVNFWVAQYLVSGGGGSTLEKLMAGVDDGYGGALAFPNHYLQCKIHHAKFNKCTMQRFYEKAE